MLKKKVLVDEIEQRMCSKRVAPTAVAHVLLPVLSDAERCVGGRCDSILLCLSMHTVSKDDVLPPRRCPSALMRGLRTGAGVAKECYLVDPASSHMLVSKIKPCMCKYELIQTVKLRMAH